jgi:hypothetical protein
MLQEGPKFIPFNLPSTVVAFNDLLTSSATRRKRSSDRGQPYLIPLLVLKNGEAEPLSKMAKEAELIQLNTQITKAWLNPRCMRISLRYSLLNLSKAGLEAFKV